MTGSNRVDIIYFTDPLCCWSWAMEPQLRKFRYQFAEFISFDIRMGGLIPSWDNFTDHINAVSRPAQMGPVWFHAEKVSGMPMADKMWTKDPPHTSFTACVAVRCVINQSPIAGEKYLRMLREACMINGENIAKASILQRVAQELRHFDPVFDYELFCNDFASAFGQSLFRGDWEMTKSMGITRLPTLILRYNGQTIRVTGYKPFSVLCSALTMLLPSVTPSTVTDLTQYTQFWGGLTEREAHEFINKNSASALQHLPEEKVKPTKF